MRVECARCGAIIQEGPEDGDISHGLCDDCYAEQMAELDRREKLVPGHDDNCDPYVELPEWPS